MDQPPVIGSVDLKDPLSEIVNKVGKHFEAKYQVPPQFTARVPGRVNLIGEHIDYCGYAVFPMAIDQAIFVAVQQRDDQQLELSNMEPSYQEFTCDLNEINIDKGNPHWYSYFLCGIKGVMEQNGFSKTEWKGMNAVVYGLIPPSAGLSSSSALVCAAALSFSRVNQMQFTKKQIAEFCAKSERYIGTEGGGMDQAIAMLATRGTAKLIEFNPLRAHDTSLPAGAVFVIAHSLAEVNKAAGFLFNCRVMECRLAAKVLAKIHGIDPQLVMRLEDVQQFYSRDKTLDDMASLVQLFLHDDPYSKSEVAKLLDLTQDQLETTILTPNTRQVDQFKLKDRALHVFQEANRVWKFREVCNSGSPKALQKLGRLMLESHVSCRDLYECSHPQLDRLVELAKTHSLGARLTGAGWGGCMVALVHQDGVDALINHLKENFYKGLPAADGRDLNQVIFATEPGDGAAIFTF